MPLASNIPEDDAWFQAYRARRAALPATGLINGLPPEQALAGAERSPVLPAPGVPMVTPQQADRAMQTAERIGAETAARQQGEKNASRDRYNAFLEESGINPNTIGGSRLTGSMGERTLQNPSLAQQQSAVDAANYTNAQEGRARIAARRAFQRGDGGMWADIMGGVNQANQYRGGGRSAEQQRSYWMDRILGAMPYRREFWGMNSNGFGGL